jgi:hypothetical protein
MLKKEENKITNKLKIFITILFAILLFTPSSDSHAAVACMYEACPFTAVNALSTDIGSYDGNYGDGGSDAGITWTWTTEISPNYVVHGTHWCTSSSGTPSGDNTGFTGYCWCRLLDINGSSCAGAWIYQSNYLMLSCRSNCASNCAFNIRSSSAFRSAVVSPENPTYKTFDLSSCPANYVAIPSNVGTVAESGLACSKGTCNISCNWQ